MPTKVGTTKALSDASSAHYLSRVNIHHNRRVWPSRSDQALTPITRDHLFVYIRDAFCLPQRSISGSFVFGAPDGRRMVRLAFATNDHMITQLELMLISFRYIHSK